MATFSMVNAGVPSSGLGDPMESWIPAYAGERPVPTGDWWPERYKGDQNKINQLRRSASEFDSQYYLQKNPDVAKNMLLGQGITSAFEHFIKYGQNENRDWRLKTGISEPESSGSSGSGNSTTSNSNSLFGTGGYLGTGVNFDSYVNKMKELTDWKLGIDKRSMENAYGFRDKEATRDYGFQTGLAGQQIQGQKDIQGQQIEGTKNLETLRNEYMNKRQSEQLANQRAMQEAGFSQQNKLLTDNANRAKSLYFGAGGM